MDRIRKAPVDGLIIEDWLFSTQVEKPALVTGRSSTAYLEVLPGMFLNTRGSAAGEVPFHGWFTGLVPGPSGGVTFVQCT